jgi:hypothetical protein
MNRLIRLALLTMTAGSMITGIASATTYYIAANGNNSNSGTSKSSPWSHAPGMPNCTSTCASTTPKAGDQFIFRGGDTWHFGSGSPLIGGEWNWQWSGSSGSPIYVGVDTTWFSGNSFARPVLNGDNPLSTNYVSTCAHDYTNMQFMVNLSQNWLTFDNFEFTGVCWSGQISGNAMIYQQGGSTNDVISKLYCHGWTVTRGAYDNFYCIDTNGGGTLADSNQYAYDVFDGSDSPHFPAGDTANCQWSGNNTVGCASGQGIYGRANDVHNSVFRYLSNFMVTNTTMTIHDNLFEYLYYSFANNAQHPNILNNLGGPAGSDLYVYNNVVRHTFVTENFFLAVRTNAYIFNNVFYDNMNTQYGVMPVGCVYLNAAPQTGGSQAVYIYNNTLGDASCQFTFANANAPLLSFNGTGTFENNHFVGYSPAALSSVYVINSSNVHATIKDNGSEIFQTTSVANGQGYTASNNYAPTSNSGASVGAGSNLTSSCSTFSSDSALCSGTSDGVTEQAADGGQSAVFPAIAIVSRPSPGAWDAGAYEFGAGGPPTPPTGLSAIVQ